VLEPLNVLDVLLVELVSLDVELEVEELLDPETETGSRIVDNALLIVLIYAHAVRAGCRGGIRPGPRFMAGGVTRRPSGY
jgi:hypothetical protein